MNGCSRGNEISVDVSLEEAQHIAHGITQFGWLPEGAKPLYPRDGYEIDKAAGGLIVQFNQ